MLDCLRFQGQRSSVIVSFYAEGKWLAVLRIRLFYNWLATLFTALTVASMILIIPDIDQSWVLKRLPVLGQTVRYGGTIDWASVFCHVRNLRKVCLGGGLRLIKWRVETDLACHISRTFWIALLVRRTDGLLIFFSIVRSIYAFIGEHWLSG